MHTIASFGVSVMAHDATVAAAGCSALHVRLSFTSSWEAFVDLPTGIAFSTFCFGMKKLLMLPGLQAPRALLKFQSHRWLEGNAPLDKK